jgi:hypothetical protein
MFFLGFARLLIDRWTSTERAKRGQDAALAPSRPKIIVDQGMDVTISRFHDRCFSTPTEMLLRRTDLTTSVDKERKSITRRAHDSANTDSRPRGKLAYLEKCATVEGAVGGNTRTLPVRRALSHRWRWSWPAPFGTTKTVDLWLHVFTVRPSILLECPVDWGESSLPYYLCCHLTVHAVSNSCISPGRTGGCEAWSCSLISSFSNQ